MKFAAEFLLFLINIDSHITDNEVSQEVHIAFSQVPSRWQALLAKGFPSKK